MIKTARSNRHLRLSASWLIIAILGIVSSGWLIAEEINLKRPLNLEQCIAIALEKSSDIKNAKLNLAIDELQIKDARSNYFPEITVNGRYNFSDKIDFGFEKENYNATVTGRYTIWDHGQREINLARAKVDKEVAESRYEQTKQRLVFDVIQAYYNLLKAQKLVQVDEKLLEQSRGNTEMIRAFRDAGKLIEADVATAEVREANDELNLINDQNAVEIAMAELPNLMGLDTGILVDILDDPDYERYIQTGFIEREKMSVDDAIETALKNRPEIKEYEATIKSLEWGLTLAKLQRWPRLTAEYDYNVYLDEYLRERENFKNFRSWNALAVLTFPLFDGGVSKRQVQKVETQLEQIREDSSKLERNIALEVHQAYLNLKRAEKALEISDKQVRDAQLSLEVTNGRFEQGMGILLELLDAQAAYAQALTSQVRAFYDYKIAKSSLQRAMGEL
ncbi:TPA: TolC family protein [Candidatus Poribacteria bacterium]|nr:TolC family protein [Candidatus Poribacteria bacterium]